MGERYNQWNADPAVKPLLEAYHLTDAPPELGDALEAVVDITMKTCERYDITRKHATSLISAQTGLGQDPLRKFIEDVRDRTIFRHNE